MAKAYFSLVKFNPRLKPGAINPRFIWASAVNLFYQKTMKIKKLKDGHPYTYQDSLKLAKELAN